MYNKIEIPFSSVPQLSDRDKMFQAEEEALQEFIELPARLESFPAAIANRQAFNTDRSLLHDVLTDQYRNRETSAAVRSNIDRLRDENTFTIVTAHQPSLLTGPLYTIYKICSAVSLSKRLNEEYPEYTFVPCFVSGGEDHDFDEIATIHLWNKDYTWQNNESGAVGRMSLDSLAPLMEELLERFGQGDHAEALRTIIKEGMTHARSYGEFFIRLINALFMEHGLVIVNMDDARFKEIFFPVVQKELLEGIGRSCVVADQERLESRGIASQAHARSVNLFVHDGDRHRVIDNEDGTLTVNSNTYTREELLTYLEKLPGAASPNVVLRPVYQELILPNLAYVGGGGEIAYWIERVSLFKELGIPFPVLVRRDSVLIIDKRSYQFLNEQRIGLEKLFDREERIINDFVKDESAVPISLADLNQDIEKTFQAIAERAKSVDPTLSRTALSEGAKAMKSIEYLENKLLKAEKKKKEITLNKITKIKHKLFPEYGLQERYDNFIPHYLRYGASWIDELIGVLDPLNKHFKILIEK